MKNQTAPYPVTVEYGFPYFNLPNGRQSAAVKVNGNLLYARDYAAGGPVDDVPREPSDIEWLVMVSIEAVAE